MISLTTQLSVTTSSVVAQPPCDKEGGTAGQHVSQFLPWPYMAPIPIQEPSVMTHTGSFLLKSTGFNIGDCIAITLML